MKIKHHSLFAGNRTSLNWEELRNDAMESPYFLPFSKEEYLKKVDVESPSKTASLLLKELKRMNVREVFSIGSGIGALEFQLKKFGKFKVIVSDHNSSVDRLRGFHCFDGAFQFDAVSDSLNLEKETVVLLPRIDTELTDHQISVLFLHCFQSGILNLVFIPAERITLKFFMTEIKILLISMLKRKPRVLCGFSRSFSHFKKLWEPYYTYKQISRIGNGIYLLYRNGNEVNGRFTSK